MVKINDHYVYAKPPILEFVDKTLKLPIYQLFGGRKIELIKEEGDTEYTDYRITNYPKPNKVKAIAALIGISLLLPILLLIKICSNENKKIAIKIALLNENKTQMPISLASEINKLAERTDEPASENNSPRSEEEEAPATPPDLLNILTFGLAGSPGTPARELNERQFKIVPRVSSN